MNWDVVSAIAEVAGALGVIVSLLYLATQIRHSVKASQDTSTKEVFASFVTQVNAMGTEPSRSALARGLVDYRNLAGVEKITFDSLLAGLFAIVESSFISNSANLMTDELMAHWSEYLQPRLFAYEGMRDWWAESKSVYVPDVQAWIDTQIAGTDMGTDFWGIR